VTTEPGRHVAEDGRIVYAWPPVGRFAALWCRLQATLPSNAEKEDAAALLARWADAVRRLTAAPTCVECGDTDALPGWMACSDCISIETRRRPEFELDT